MNSYLKGSFWIVGAIAGITALGVVGGFIGTVGKVASAPQRVINKTFDTDNIINNYEWFHDVNGRVQARAAQVAEYKGLLKSETDKDERFRLRTELAGMQQSCRDMANQYNANSVKTNRSIFKGREAPETLDPSICE